MGKEENHTWFRHADKCIGAGRVFGEQFIQTDYWKRGTLCNALVSFFFFFLFEIQEKFTICRVFVFLFFFFFEFSMNYFTFLFHFLSGSFLVSERPSSRGKDSMKFP